MITQDKGSEYRDRSRFYGLSTDSKPTNCGNASTFYEMDTTREFIFDKKNEIWCPYNHGGNTIVQPSTSPKPTGVAYGTRLEETDTGKRFFYDAENSIWKEMT